MTNTVIISGGFDPDHQGHRELIRHARKIADKLKAILLVIINNDNWLIQKKGYYFLNKEERADRILSIKGVDEVFVTLHEKYPEDMSVCEELKILRPKKGEYVVFCNGGDRYNSNTPEYAVCKELGIELMFNVGGEKTQSSSKIIEEGFRRYVTGNALTNDEIDLFKIINEEYEKKFEVDKP